MTSQIISIFFLIADPAAPANFAEFMRWEAAAFGFGRGKKIDHLFKPKHGNDALLKRGI